MIVQVFAHTRQIRDDLDVQVTQVVRRPEAAQHHQLSGADGARAQHHFGGFGTELLSANGVFDAGGPVSVEHHALHQGIRDHVEVGARAQVGVRSALPGPRDDVQVDPADTLLQAAADVRRTPVSYLCGRIHERRRRRMLLLCRGDLQRAADAAQRRIPSGSVLTALEERQQVVELPALAPVVTAVVPSGEDHAVDAGGASQRFSAWPSESSAEFRLRQCRVLPI